MAFTPDEERQLKEILYLLMEKVRATKAAFYVVDSGSFALAASYGFGRTDRIPDRLQRSDELMSAVHAHRDLYFVNDIRQAGPLAEHMSGASSTRLLFCPFYVDARLTGILDVRDKAGREPFLPEDAGWVKEIGKRLVERLARLNHVPKKRVPTRPSRAAKKRRMEEKKLVGRTKRTRGRVASDE
jgi:putative methionine-R-sulfoxide reductase with GAF domain